MADNNYPVAPNFPLGLLLDQLIEEMPAVWPADLFPSEYTLNGPPQTTVTSGALKIETPRALTPAEDAAAIAHFATHDPTSGILPGVTIAQLPDPTPAGVLLYVRDLDHATGPGVGTMAYSNGVEWRRVSNDSLV